MMADKIKYHLVLPILIFITIILLPDILLFSQPLSDSRFNQEIGIVIKNIDSLKKVSFLTYLPFCGINI